MKVVTPLGLPDTLDEQTFVRTLNALCLTHGMQLLILDSPHSLSVQRKFCRPLKVSSPAVIASRIAARLVAMVLDAKVRGLEPMPWVDSDITPWRLSDDLLELTPRDIWGFLKSHPNYVSEVTPMSRSILRIAVAFGRRNRGSLRMPCLNSNAL